MAKFWALVVILVLFFANVASANSSLQSAVSSAHPLATKAGISILKQGGNAFDAAVAVTAVLAVVEPYSSGLGGGGFWLLHSADTKKDIMIDGRERAPLAATKDMYLDNKGNAIPSASIDGALSAGIPGVPAALDVLANDYGKLPLSSTLQPAITIARNGFLVDDYFRRIMRFRLPAIQDSWAASEIFSVNDQVPEKGYLLKQVDLANTLEAMAQEGADGFYKGPVAKKLITAVQEAGGIWTQGDLDSYEIVKRQPIVGEYKGMTITSVAPPSSGGIAIVQMFNMLAELDYENATPAQRIHLVTEVMRRAYRDRAEYLGDSDFVDVPVEKLISKSYAKKLISGVSLKTATLSSSLKAIGVDNKNSVDTTHFSIIDNMGNRVAATLSVNYPFGSGFVAEGTGVLLNDEMDDFSVKPNTPNVYGLVGGVANAIEPGKRMLSSMSPTFIETKDRLAIVGTPGGSRIITMVMLAALAFYENVDAKTIVNLPRYHHQYLPDKLFFETKAFNSRVRTQLSKMGHTLEEKTSSYGNMQIIIKNKKTGLINAASDERGIGASLVVRHQSH